MFLYIKHALLRLDIYIYIYSDIDKKYKNDLEICWYFKIIDIVLINIPHCAAIEDFFKLIFIANILRGESDANIGTSLTDGSRSVTCVSINLSLDVYYRLENSFSFSSIRVFFKGKMCNLNIPFYLELQLVCFFAVRSCLNYRR